MANRQEIIADLSALLTDKSKLDKFVSKLDEKAEIAQELNLTSKENEVEQETEKQPTELEQVALSFIEALKPVMDEVKSLRAEVAELKSGVVKSIGDSPAVTVADLVKQYMGTSETAKPDPKSLKTPQITKESGQPTDGFALLANGAFDKPRKQ